MAAIYLDSCIIIGLIEGGYISTVIIEKIITQSSNL
jgi:hypothetical protein